MSDSTRPFRFGVQVGELLSRSELIDCAQMSEELGYGVFSCTDHLDHAFPQMAPMVVLAAVAAVTRHIELQPMVLANGLRHPVSLAKEAASLDQLSDGRFALGLGAGWLPADFKRAGMEFHSPCVRIARLAETIEILRGLHTGESFNYQGEFYNVSDLVGTPQPVRSPMPLLVAGSGKVLLSLAARTADTVALNPGLPLGAGDWQTGPAPYADVTDRKLEWVKAALRDPGDLPEIQTTVMAGGITNGDTETLIAPVAAMLGVSVAQLAGSPHVLAGTEEQCIETIRAWRMRWGISYITFPASIAGQMAAVVKVLRNT